MKTKYVENKAWITKYFNNLDNAIEDTAQFIVWKIQDITPRDPERPPKDPSQPVTWSLKRSIWYERVGLFTYKIWTKQGEKNSETWEDVATYWFDLEYWTKYIPARPFISKWVFDNVFEIEQFLGAIIRKKL